MPADYKKYPYTSDTGTTHPISIDIPTFTAQTTPPVAGGTTSAISAKISLGRREGGIRPRHLVLTREVGTAPNAKTLYTKLVVLLPADYAAFQTGGAVTVNSIAWTIGQKEPERQR